MFVAVVLFLFANAGYHWIPIAYAGENLKQDMQTAVLQGLSGSGKSPIELVKKKILASATSNNIPEDVFVEVKTSKDSITAHVVYTQEVPLLPFGIYNYEYEFDYTATPTGFLTE
ncbi:MAG TPA: hypothetical protein VIL74_19945 [Pyrinomonadaceae bacterium]